MEFTVSKILWTLLGLFIVLNWGLIMGGTMRKIVARVGKRYGIPIYQPYIDLIKNYAIRSQITHGVMFYLGPVFRKGNGILITIWIK